MFTVKNKGYDILKWSPGSVIAAILCGVVLGEILTVSAAFIFMAALMFLVYLLIFRAFEDPAERTFVTRFFLIGLFLRLALCVGLYFICEFKNHFYTYYGYIGNCIFGDSAFASVNGLWISQWWNGQLKPSDIDPSFFLKLNSINPYIYAVFYNVFGFKELSAKFIDVILGAVTPVFIYLITKV